VGGIGVDAWLVLGEVARFRFGSDCPRLENTGTCTLRVLGDGVLDSRLRLQYDRVSAQNTVLHFHRMTD